MSPRTANPEKRAAILEAALYLYVDQGFHGTNVPDVARRAGVGAGTIYRHFESKEHLVNELYRSWKERLAQHLLREFPFDDSPRVQFRTWFVRYAEFARTFPRAQAFLELHHHAAYLDEASRALEQRLLEMMRAILIKMQAAGAVKSDVPPTVLIALCFGAVVGLVRAAHEGHLVLDDDTIRAAERCCWEAIRG